MRVYEFAQLNNISSKDLIGTLQKNGFDVKSHMSILDEKAISFLNKLSTKAAKDVHKDIEPLTKSQQPTTPIEEKVTQLSSAIPSKKSVSEDKKHPSITQKNVASKKEEAVLPVMELQLHQMTVAELADKI